MLIQKFFLKSKILDKYFAIFTTLIIIFYFLNAVLFSKNTFNNHLFLLFTEAKQFLDYKVLYKEIHVLYGVGQALFNALSLYFFGPNVFSIQLNANIFYFFSIFFILLICLKLNLNRFDSLFLILIIINLHPIPLLAWSTYLAFLPLVMSLYFALEKKKINLFFSGLLLAIACLNRETILLSAVIIFFYITYEFVLKNKNIAIFKLYLLGFSFVLTIFTIYMFVSLNYLIWLELIYPLNRWQSLINIGYYIQTDITPLRKFYIFVFAPYREIFFTFLKSIYNFWPHWILIFTSYFSCIFILFIRITKNKFLDENEHLKYSLSIISIYSLSLILQNIHQVGIDRVATGSVLGLIVLFFIYSKVVKNHKIRILFYIIILLFFFIRPYDTFNKVNLKELYKLSFYNIKNNINFYFHNQKSLNNYKKIPEFKFMNYNQSVHEFYTKVQEICEDLRIIKGVKYSDNQTPFWELSYFCKTQPKYYYVLPSTAFSEENFKKSQFKYNSNNINTVEFHVSNDIGLKEEDYIDIRGFTKKRYLKDFKIIHIFDLREKYPDMYKDYKIRYLFFIQKIK